MSGCTTTGERDCSSFSGFFFRVLFFRRVFFLSFFHLLRSLRDPNPNLSLPPFSLTHRGNFESFEEMYDQRRAEANKAADKFDKAMKAAKRSGGGKAAQEKVVKGAKAAAKGKGGGARGKKGGNDDDLGPSASGKDNPDAPRR